MQHRVFRLLQVHVKLAASAPAYTLLHREASPSSYNVSRLVFDWHLKMSDSVILEPNKTEWSSSEATEDYLLLAYLSLQQQPTVSCFLTRLKSVKVIMLKQRDFRRWLHTGTYDSRSQGGNWLVVLSLLLLLSLSFSLWMVDSET